MHASPWIVGGLLQDLYYVGVVRNIGESELFKYALLYSQVETRLVHGDDVVGPGTGSLHLGDQRRLAGVALLQDLHAVFLLERLDCAVGERGLPCSAV